MAWLLNFIISNGQPFSPPDASVVYPRVGNSSFYSWIILKNPAYASCVDTQTNLPVWVSHAITKESIEFGDTISRKRPKGYSEDNRYKRLKKQLIAVPVTIMDMWLRLTILNRMPTHMKIHF